MFGFIKSLFSSNTDKVLDMVSGVGGWIDGQQFTEQEKSEASFKVLEYKLKWLNATQGMNLARRYLAMMFCITFLSVFCLCIFCAVIGFSFGIDVSGLIDQIVKLSEAFKIGWVTLTIVVFYFGKGIAEGVMKK